MNLFPKTYGRTKGKIKKPSLLNYYKKINKYLIDSMSQYNKDIILEIGSGNGENIIKLSNLYKDKIIIACEVYIDGNSSLVKKLENKKIKNVKIFDKSCFYLFKKIKKFSIDQIWILFPDPWPKKRHYKRRLISKLLLKEIFKVLKKDGLFYISTDSESYLDSILKEFLFNYNFLWMNKTLKDCQKRSKILIESKYEKKAKIKGNKNFFLKFKKIC